MFEFTIAREALLKPCQRVMGAVEKRSTLPILSNLLLVVKNQLLMITGTDLEIEMVARVPLEHPCTEGRLTVPAKKLVDICKALNDGALIQLSCSDGQRATLKSGKSRFNLVCLSADDYPSMDEEGPGSYEFSIKQQQMRFLLESTSFAMAQQDSRYYLNGLLFEITNQQFKAVGADGHRLAMVNHDHAHANLTPTSVIIPRKAVLELQRLFAEGDDDVGVVIGDHHLKAISTQYSFMTKLIDGKFPDFKKVLPKGGNQEVVLEKDVLKQALSRIAVLLTDRRQGVGLIFSDNKLKIEARNMERDEGEEELDIDYQGPVTEIGFNVNYLIEYLSHIKCEHVKVSFSNPESSVLFEPVTQDESSSDLYVVMPMRL